MATRILYLFPDTNLFVQCRPLHELGWKTWAEFDEVHVIVSRPVQSEIDQQKNRGNDRVGKRARAASSLLREIIVGTGEKRVRDTGPAVKVFVRQYLKPDADLSDRLDYGEPDDRLVGIAHAFLQQNPGVEARILTHDTGPLASAKMVGVPFEVIPDEWLLTPENTEGEKKIRELEREVARLKKTEPDIQITCFDSEGQQINKIEIGVPHYPQLKADEVSELMGRIMSRFPMASDFGQESGEPEPDMRRWSLGYPTRVFIPATEKDISTYKVESYPAWLGKCEEILRDYHASLERRSGAPRFVFSAENDGTRPAKDALVTIVAKGGIALLPPRNKEKEQDGEEAGALVLPGPPRAPQGRWEMQEPLASFRNVLGGSLAGSSRLEGLMISHLPARRDPNKFYWKPQPNVPVSEMNLECEQWRHGLEPEEFEVELFFDRGQESISAALECRIHSENQSRVETLTVPVRIGIREVSTFEMACAMVETLVGR